MNEFLLYAQNYNVSVATAIRDRDWPLTKKECIKEFVEATGKQPTEQEITEMRPDDDRATEDYRNEQIADYRSVYG